MASPAMIGRLIGLKLLLLVVVVPTSAGAYIIHASPIQMPLISFKKYEI